VGDAEPEKFGFYGKFIRRFDLLNNEESAFVNLGCCTGCYQRVKNSDFYPRRELGFTTGNF
jgi:hypothetical protein